ncbi:MAG: hypothetical protein JWO36_1832 [Myxococcales bacterium]|nr:hypothetical protein [Myxococcales bacterium]
MIKRVLVAAIALSASFTTARADNRAWTAAKKALPANLQVVMGFSATPLRSSELFKQLLPKALQNSGPAKAHLDKVKTACNLDLIEQLDSAVVGVTAAQEDVFVVALKSTTRKELDACIVKVNKLDKKTVTITEDGQVTKYVGLSDKDIYLRWLAKDSFAVVAATDSKDLLLKLTDGGIADDKAFKAPLAAVKTTSAVWVLMNKTQDLDQVGAKMHAAYGQADIKGGVVLVDLHIVVEDAKSATDAAGRATGQVDLLKSSGKVPPEYQSLLSGLKFTAAGSELRVNASASEKEILGMLGAFMGST